MKLWNYIKNNKLECCEYIFLALITFFLIFPMKNAKLILAIITIIWLVIAFLNDKKLFFDFFIKPHLVTYSVYIWGIINVYVMIFTNIIPVSLNFAAIAFGILLYLYYLKKEEKKGIYVLLITALSTITIVNLTTIFAVMINPNISRLLSTTLKENFNYFGIGNYSYIYGLVFITLALIMAIFNVKKNIKIKIIGLIIALLSMFCIYKTAFLIAIILLIFGFILIVLKINTTEKLLLYVCLGLTIGGIFIYSGFALKFFTYLSENTNNNYFKSRFNDIAIVLKNEDITKTDDLKIRLSVYKQSFDAFLDSPLVGMLNENYLETGKQAGGHSVILDEFARFGLIFSIPFFAMFFLIIKNIKKTFNNIKYQKCWFIISLCAIILGLINTMMFPTLIFMVFTIVPVILKFCELRDSKEGTI